MEEELKKAAEEYSEENYIEWEKPIDSVLVGTPRTRTDNDKWYIKEAFIAGAEWMAKQGKIIDGNIEVGGKFRWIDLDDSTLREQLMSFKNGDKVIVQIRKK